MTTLSKNIVTANLQGVTMRCTTCSTLFTRGRHRGPDEKFCKTWSYIAYDLNYPIVDGTTLHIKGGKLYQMFFNIFEIEGFKKDFSCKCSECGVNHYWSPFEENIMDSQAKIYLAAVKFNRSAEMKAYVGERKFNQIAARGLKKAISGKAN